MNRKKTATILIFSILCTIIFADDFHYRNEINYNYVNLSNCFLFKELSNQDYINRNISIFKMHSNKNNNDEDMKLKPIILSLSLSHGAGLYSLQYPKEAKKYLWTNILFFDIPIAILVSSIILNNSDPSFFQGTTLIISEYIINSCIISIPLTFIATRVFESREVYKKQKKRN